MLSIAKPKSASIFNKVPNVNAKLPFRDQIKNPEVIWLEPDIRCRVKYLELDSYGLMRHPVFNGLIN
jgi:bifunctional non-homologous end joining protein LigD